MKLMAKSLLKKTSQHSQIIPVLFVFLYGAKTKMMHILVEKQIS